MNYKYIKSEKMKTVVPYQECQKNVQLSSSFLTPNLDFSNAIKKYLGQISESIKFIHDIILKSGVSKINKKHVEVLNKFFWVIPFEYKYEKLESLLKYKARKEFEKYMVKYFNNNRTKRIFSKIRRWYEEKDKKELLKQVERAFYRGDYAICITNLITLLDGITLILLTNDSKNQHLSYKIIKSLKSHVSKHEFNYEFYLEIYILSNFYDILYKNENILKNNRKIKLSRHLNSHGVKYSNKKIDVLRLLNVIFFCQVIIKKTEDISLQFYKDNSSKRFLVKYKD